VAATTASAATRAAEGADNDSSGGYSGNLGGSGSGNAGTSEATKEKTYTELLQLARERVKPGDFGLQPVHAAWGDAGKAEGWLD
jgi:hypothetical protein